VPIAVIGTARGRARRGRALPVVALALALLAAGIGLGSPTPVLGHAGLVQVSPADGERLEVSPGALTIDFTEPVGISPGAVRLIDAAGTPIALEPPTIAGTRVTQPMPPLADGWHLATWSVVSADGHIVHGAVAFAVGDAEGPPPNASEGSIVAIPTAAARALGDAGLLAAIGGIGAFLLLGAGTRRVRRLVLAASVLGAAGGVTLAAIVVADAGQAAFAAPAVIAALVRAALLAVVAAAVALERWRIGAALAAPALAITMVGGHPGGDPLTAVLLLLHLSGAALWLGAAPSVLLVLRDWSVPQLTAEGVVRRFSKAAPLTLALTVGGGSVLAFVLTDAFAVGLDARYLGLLAAKAALVGLAALLGATTRRRLARGTVDRGRLTRLFLVDTVLFVVVVALSAGLAAGAPRDVTATDGDVHVGHCSLDTTTGVASLTLLPARVGDNTLYLDGAGLLEHARVELRLAGDPGAIVIDAAPSGAGWVGAGAIPVAGTWDAAVAIGRDPFTEERVMCQLRIVP
jgi:copper transport protein